MICEVSQYDAFIENNMPKRRFWMFARLPCFVSCIWGIGASGIPKNRLRAMAECGGFQRKWRLTRIIGLPFDFMPLSDTFTRNDTVRTTFLYLAKVVTGRCP
jgi:hypothetical protein